MNSAAEHLIVSVEQMHEIIEELDCAVNDLMWFSGKGLSWSKARCPVYVTGNASRQSKYNWISTISKMNLEPKKKLINNLNSTGI